MNFAAPFGQGLAYEAFLRKYGNDEQQRRWSGVHAQVVLSEPQKQLLQSFTREMKVLILAGTWCGDCVNQCPIFAHFAAQNAKIGIHYFDRDDNPELAQEMSICGAPRIPSVLFLSEDGFSCGRVAGTGHFPLIGTSSPANSVPRVRPVSRRRKKHCCRMSCRIGSTNSSGSN